MHSYPDLLWKYNLALKTVCTLIWQALLPKSTINTLSTQDGRSNIWRRWYLNLMGGWFQLGRQGYSMLPIDAAHWSGSRCGLNSRSFVTGYSTSMANVYNTWRLVRHSINPARTMVSTWCVAYYLLTLCTDHGAWCSTHTRASVAPFIQGHIVWKIFTLGRHMCTAYGQVSI
jgi:hypothetical protein